VSKLHRNFIHLYLPEALALLRCDDVVKPSYVREAFRLLRKSIMETEDVTFDDEGFDDDDEDGFDDE